jgi:hypothetical protein
LKMEVYVCILAYIGMLTFGENSFELLISLEGYVNPICFSFSENMYDVLVNVFIKCMSTFV